MSTIGSGLVGGVGKAVQSKALSLKIVERVSGRLAQHNPEMLSKMTGNEAMKEIGRIVKNPDSVKEYCKQQTKLIKDFVSKFLRSGQSETDFYAKHGEKYYTDFLDICKNIK